MKTSSLKNTLLFFISLSLIACNQEVDSSDQSLNDELIIVADSIAQLMAQFHYNPGELAEDSYLELNNQVKKLAKSAPGKEAFTEGFNSIWQNGPFSHVRLAPLQTPANEMAGYIDSLRVGEQSVSLKWIGQTTILTVSTMTGVDTKEGVFEAYREIREEPTRALIIDLRNNEGGTFAGIPLVGHLLVDPLDVGMFVSRKWWNDHSQAPQLIDIQNLEAWQGWSIKSFWQDVQEEPLTRITFLPMTPRFKGPVYVLINEKTASAAEFTADAFAHLEQVTLIGETTAGEMLSQKMFDLPHGFQLSLPIAEYHSTRMGRIEGKGVQPEIEIDQGVALDLAMLLANGEDLEEAKESLQAKLTEMEE